MPIITLPDGSQKNYKDSTSIAKIASEESAAEVGAIIVAALVGVIPGCGPQIIVMTSYVEGILGFPGLVSNAISQDGDALFPLLVRHRAASLWATLHTALPALITGLILYYFG